MSGKRVKRETEDGLAEAERLFREAGLDFECEMPRGRGHTMAVGILPDGGRIRIPVASTPARDGGAAFLVRKSIRRALREHSLRSSPA